MADLSVTYPEPTSSVADAPNVRRELTILINDDGVITVRGFYTALNRTFAGELSGSEIPGAVSAKLKDVVNSVLSSIPMLQKMKFR